MRLARWLPFLGWPRITAASLRADLVAGITVSLVAIPQSLAYAQLSGVPPLYGLYAAFIPAIVGALLVVALISFMEAMSSCKVIAIRKRTRWDENQELVGQGLAKIAAALCQSMPVSGSFSRSALNLAAGAVSGLSSVFAAAFVVATLLFFTSYLYDLPKPVLAAMIMLAVLNLIDVRAMRQAWRASHDDGLAAIITFAATLAFAPNIQIGILTGILLSLAAFLYRRMRPRIALVSLHADGTLRDAEHLDLPPLHARIGALRFDASLYFANAAYFEEAVLRLERDRSGLAFILVAAHSINDIDATGVEVLRTLAERLRQNGVTLVLSGVKRQVMDVLERTGAIDVLGRGNLYGNDQAAIADLHARLGAAGTA